MLRRSVILNFLGQAGVLLAGFVSSILLARLLGPANRGLLGVLSSVSSFCVVLGGIGIPFAVAYFGSLRDRSSGALLGSTLAYASALAVLLVPLAAVLHDPLSSAFARGEGTTLQWVLTACLVPLSFLEYTTQNQVLGQKRFGLYNLILVLSKLAGVTAVVLLVWVFRRGVTGGLVALAVGSLAVIATALPPIVAEGRPRVDRSLLRRLAGYGVRVQAGSIFQILNYRLDVIVLQFFRPLSKVGYYVVAQIVAELVTTLSSAFATSVLPLVASDADAATETTSSSLRHHGVLSVVAIVGNAVFGPLLIFLAYGSGYHAAIVPMLIILPGMWFLGTGAVVTGDLRGRDRPGLASILAGATAIVTVVVDVTLIPPFGVVGAAIGSLVAYTFYGIASLVTLSRVAELPFRSLLPNREDVRLYGAYARRVLSTRTLRPPAPER
jgi:O-antigen/teichoic acid export membrane protein